MIKQECKSFLGEHGAIRASLVVMGWPKLLVWSNILNPEYVLQFDAYKYTEIFERWRKKFEGSERCFKDFAMKQISQEMTIGSSK